MQKFGSHDYLVRDCASFLPQVGKESGAVKYSRHWLSKAKAFLIELAAFVSLLMVLVKIIVTEVHCLFR